MTTHRLIVEIETTEAQVEELREAVETQLETLELPNGDRMYLDRVRVRVVVVD